MAKKKKQETGNATNILKELFQATVNLRGTIGPTDYKRYVLPFIFLRFLSLRFENRREELIRMVKEPQSEYYTTNKEDIEEIITDPVEYGKVSVFMVPETASWDYILKNAQAVKNVLRKMQIKREVRDAFISLFIVQAEALYKNWPSAA